MRFSLRKLTLLDYPGHVACTVFTGGCNFRCPFCHNPSLVTAAAGDLEFTMGDILEFLEKRSGQLDGICITGGEPLLHRDTLLLAQAAKALNYSVKLDTNGSFPELLNEVLAEKMIDYVAMDIKNSPAKYAVTTGINVLEKVRKSVDLLKTAAVEHEFRTTVTGNLHETADFIEIGKWLTGEKRYFLQPFADSGAILGGDPGQFTVSDARLQEFLDAVRNFIPAAEIRGR